jgi:hypothetical protein
MKHFQDVKQISRRKAGFLRWGPSGKALNQSRVASTETIIVHALLASSE